MPGLRHICIGAAAGYNAVHLHGFADRVFCRGRYDDGVMGGLFARERIRIATA
jgi:hypothetical protein